MASERFLTLADVADVLNISASQTYALVRNGDLKAIRVGGRNQWRVEREQLESYIAQMYDQTQQFVATHPFTGGADEPTDADKPSTAHAGEQPRKPRGGRLPAR